MQYLNAQISDGSTALAAVPIRWQLAQTGPGAAGDPTRLAGMALDWQAACVPGTVAQSLFAAGRWSFSNPVDFSANDWWYRGDFFCSPESAGTRATLYCDGLATLAEVWLNGACVLRSDNMYVSHAVDVGPLSVGDNTLYLCFRSLNAALSARRPRPRWKTKLVNHQQLRWVRTSLLGRIPGWSPPVAPVGPWRGVALVPDTVPTLTDIRMAATLDGNDGVLVFQCTASGSLASDLAATISIGGRSVVVDVGGGAGGVFYLSGQVRLSNVRPWWPHTHGEPVLYPCRLALASAGREHTLELGRIGFRSIAASQAEGTFGLSVNGRPVFCRGACWTVNDVVSLTGTPEGLVHALALARDAGMNMLRVGGTMVYESDEFYARCDELGILVWQDFMFANMDYPVDDAHFKASVELEVSQQLRRLSVHPCIATYCGNSEVEQQAAMLGMPKDVWRNALFADLLPGWCGSLHPGIPYVPSTPSGGVLPFHVGTGITHYYGVGAYRRPVSDARRAKVRFASECLGFSQVPEPELLATLMEGVAPVTHHPRWKAGVPRDTGSAWDFEDVRDHYLEQLFGVNAMQLRSFDMDRYLALSRVVTGEVMAQVFSEWRSVGSTCRGALVWFYKDLWPGAGWGILDSSGGPKACYYYLRRVWRTCGVVLTDEGLDGVQAHVINEADVPLVGRVEFMLLKDGKVVVAQASQPCAVPPAATSSYSSDEVLNGFYDVSYAYRFGPPQHAVTVVTLFDAVDQVISEAFHFPVAQVPTRWAQVQLTAEVVQKDADVYQLTLQSDIFLYAVHFDTKGYLPDDNYFHLVPNRRKTVVFRRAPGHATAFTGYVESLSLNDAVKIAVDAGGSTAP